MTERGGVAAWGILAFTLVWSGCECGPVSTGSFDPPRLVLPPGATGRARLNLSGPIPRDLSVRVSGPSAVTPPQATLGDCDATGCEVTVTTSLETSVQTTWQVDLEVASLEVVMADDPKMSLELLTVFLDDVPRALGYFGASTQLAAKGTVAVFSTRSHGTDPAAGFKRWSIWRDDGGWAQEAAFEDRGLGPSPISRDGNRIVVSNRDGGSRVFSCTDGGWAVEAAIPGLTYPMSVSADGTWLTSFTTVFAHDAGGWYPSFVDSSARGLWISDQGLVLAAQTQAGSIIYRRQGDAWVPEVTVPSSSAHFSFSADGNTFVLMTPLEARSTGVARVFQRTNGQWLEQAVLRADPGHVLNQFGMSGALSSDGNRLIIGATGEQLDGSERALGAVYVFTRHGTSWVRNLRLAPEASTGFNFGAVSVASDGSRFLVGEPGNSLAEQFSGAAFFYRVLGEGS